MFIVRDTILIHAPIQRCFALSTSVDVVRLELGMIPVAGRTSGCVRGKDTVRWEGWQLGLWHFHVSLISVFKPFRFFQDRMIAGRFRRFEHDHHLEETAAGVILRDEIRFCLPLGFLGRLVGTLIVEPHIRRLERRRMHLLKTLAEGEGWREWVPE